MLIPLEMLPNLVAERGVVRIVKPLPSDAVLPPGVAIAYAQALIEAAATAEGDMLISSANKEAGPAPL